MTEEARKLAEELREYTAMKYAGDCKCGKCQLVPRALVERIYHTLNSAALRSQPGTLAREEVARITPQHIADYLFEQTTNLGSPITYTACLTMAKYILALTPSHEAGMQEPVARREECDRAETVIARSVNCNWIMVQDRNQLKATIRIALDTEVAAGGPYLNNGWNAAPASQDATREPK